PRTRIPSPLAGEDGRERRACFRASSPHYGERPGEGAARAKRAPHPAHPSSLRCDGLATLSRRGRGGPSAPSREDAEHRFVIPRTRPLPMHLSFAWRLAMFYAALFVALGVQLPFLPLWLAAKGLDAGAIGVALALPMVVRVFAIPLATRGADRHDALRTPIVIAAALSVLGYGPA